MILKELLECSEYTLVQGSEDVEISTLVYDSRKIEKGSVFVCISGAAFDGHKFVAQAARSEERRVGKECRSRWSPYH